MSDSNWADFFATTRFVFGQLLQIVTMVGVIASGYYAFRAKLSADNNNLHLRRQDADIAEVDRKVDGQTATMIEATKEHAVKVAVVVKEKSDEDAEHLRAEIARLHDRLEMLSVAPPTTPALIVPAKPSAPAASIAATDPRNRVPEASP